MKTLALTEELAKVAQRVIWFEQPDEALADPIRFVAYAMTYGTHDDMNVVRQYLSDDVTRSLGPCSTRHLRSAFLGLLAFKAWAVSAAASHLHV